MPVRPLRNRLVPLIVFALAAAATAEPAATQPTTRPATYSLPEIDATVTLPDRWRFKRRVVKNVAPKVCTYAFERRGNDVGLAGLDVTVTRMPSPLPPERAVASMGRIMEQSIADLRDGAMFGDVYIAERGRTKLNGMPACYVIAEGTMNDLPGVRVRMVGFVAIDADRSFSSLLTVTADGWDVAWDEYKQLMNSIRLGTE